MTYVTKVSWQLLITALLIIGCGDSDSRLPPGANGERKTSNLTPPEAIGSAKYNGYDATRDKIVNRLLVDDSSFELTRYMGGKYSSLGSLVGVHVGNGLEFEFRNADPNPVNMMIWFMTFKGLSKEIALQCTDMGEPPEPWLGPFPWLSEATFEDIWEVCEWPAAQAKSRQSLYRFWKRIMAYDAPESEFEHWFAAVSLDESLAQAPAAEAIPIMLMALWHNPYFLLQN